MNRDITLGDKYDPAMEIEDQATADAYFEACITHTMTFGKSRTDAEQIERINLGYWAGYYSTATRARVERLFRCAHPIFGSVAVNGVPTMEEALIAGRKRGEAAKAEGR